ncbi:MAG: NAD-dependent epimerase/dehydratase family protein [Verrucomicrobiota bacterium]|jgi:dTDP-glucose 4,6-dehydratase/UDP-glucuronate decarboxylase
MDPHLTDDARRVIADLGPLNQRFAGKTILLTGAAGFLGSHFLHYFLALNDSCLAGQPCRLIAWDNFARGAPPWLESIPPRPDLLCERRDIVQKQALAPVDFIIHAASIASPVFYRKHPIQTMDANVTGLRHLLDAAVARPVESFLFFSTSEIYGDPDPANIPTRETYRGNVSCTGPRSCYDESKRYGETLCVNFWQVHHVPVKIVRPFNNYGPGLKISDRRVLPDFFRDVLAGRNLVLLSDGRATRTFCYISDAINGYLRALLSGHQGESFNIGADAPEISMRALAEMVVKISGQHLRVEHRQSDDPKYLTDNPQRRCPSLEKSRRLLAYEPRVPLPTGLERMYQYYLANPFAEDK